MANFEGLIRQALAKQNASDPQMRAKIYQSSRSALSRMLEKAGNIPQEVIDAQQTALEKSIITIEAEYASPIAPSSTPEPIEPPKPTAPPAIETSAAAPPPPPPVSPPAASVAPVREPQLDAVVPERAPEPAPEPPPQPIAARSATLQPEAPQPKAAPAAPASMPTPMPTPIPAATPAPTPTTRTAVAPEPVAETVPKPSAQPVEIPATGADLPPEDFASNYRSKKRISIRLFGFLGILAIIAITLALGYLLFNTLSGNNTVTNQAVRNDPSINPNRPTIVSSETPGSYVIILDPANPSSVISDGRGEVSIVDFAGEKALRIASVRPEDKRRDVAPPILFQLNPGVLKQIAGKRVTFVIDAKSSAASRAQFTVECQFGAAGSCDRKRFPVGIQPEKAVFSVQMAESIPENTKAYLAINTDVTTSAAITGKGDILDILSVRVGLPAS